jgi:hypothetical protein
VTGLTIAWGGTALLVSPLARALGDPTALRTAAIGQVLFWLLAPTVLVIVLVTHRTSSRKRSTKPKSGLRDCSAIRRCVQALRRVDRRSDDIHHDFQLGDRNRVT